ncbi:hypothetical protein GEMRC1_006502 [Eukaryota sp. GEM-RC1]
MFLSFYKYYTNLISIEDIESLPVFSLDQWEAIEWTDFKLEHFAIDDIWNLIMKSDALEEIPQKSRDQRVSHLLSSLTRSKDVFIAPSYFEWQKQFLFNRLSQHKHCAYDQSLPLTCLFRASEPFDMQQCYDSCSSADLSKLFIVIRLLDSSVLVLYPIFNGFQCFSCYRGSYADPRLKDDPGSFERSKAVYHCSGGSVKSSSFKACPSGSRMHRCTCKFAVPKVFEPLSINFWDVFNINSDLTLTVQHLPSGGNFHIFPYFCKSPFCKFKNNCRFRDGSSSVRNTVDT